MKLKTKQDLINQYKSNDMLVCECENCGKDFQVKKSAVMRCIKGQKNVSCCSRKCLAQLKTKNHSNKLKCLSCGKEFLRLKKMKKCKNSFCSRDCYIRYSSKENKTRNERCFFCGSFLKNKKSRFCSHRCHSEYKKAKNIKDWKDGNKNGYRGKIILISSFVRDYLFSKYKNKCMKCGWSEINQTTGKVPLQVHHVNGDAKDCKEENLELLCPNCHSITSNFMSLNKDCKRKR